MPKKTEKWECEICKTIYDNSKEATYCENSHEQDISVFKPELYYTPKKSYPSTIILHIGGMDRAVYVLKAVSDNADGA